MWSTKANITQQTKLLVYGYQTREFPLQLIPCLIHYLICIFYCINDYFLDPVADTNGTIEITNNGKRIKVIQDDVKLMPNVHRPNLPLICGANIIHCSQNMIQLNDTSIGKYVWSIKYQYNPESRAICFGIVSNNDNQEFNRKLADDKQLIWHYPIYYALSCKGFCFNSDEQYGDKLSVITKCDHDSHFNNSKNIIHLCLDVRKMRFTVKINNEPYSYVIASKIDFKRNIKFFFIIQIPILKTTEIKMIDFKTEK